MLWLTQMFWYQPYSLEIQDELILTNPFQIQKMLFFTRSLCLRKAVT